MKQILLVDDNDDLREITQNLLEFHGFSVITAGHGREALDLLESNAHPDLLLTDLSMPVMDGIELIAELKKRDVKIPIVIQSALTRSQIPAGYEFLRKPFEIKDLISVVRRHCGE